MVLYSPHLMSPVGNEVFNLGYVMIEWHQPSPPSDDSNLRESNVFYEIEYTESYLDGKTVWHAIHTRWPWSNSSYNWKVGKLIKTEHARVRVRTRRIDTDEVSEWSMSTDGFTVNVRKLIPPAIANPVAGNLYTDFIQIILDESLTRNTYNQKVLYTLDFKSEDQDLDWTLIAQNLPFGTNVIRWDLANLLPSDDYVLRLTAEGRLNNTNEIDQISRAYVYNIRIQQPGAFIIDTQPPDAILVINSPQEVSNVLDHMVDIYADDETTAVTSVQLHECDGIQRVKLGRDISATDAAENPDECSSMEDLIKEGVPVPNPMIGKTVNYNARTNWEFTDKSGLRKLEALVIDAGGNTSLQTPRKVFLDLYKSDSPITDMIISREEVTKTTPHETSSGGFEFETTSFVTELLFFSRSDGAICVLEPYSREIYYMPSGATPVRLFKYEDTIYICTYNDVLLRGAVYRHDSGEATKLYDFPSLVSKAMAITSFQDNLYICLMNGELWMFDGSSFSLVRTFASQLLSAYADTNYMYLGFSNSNDIVVYNGTTFTTSNLG